MKAVASALSHAEVAVFFLLGVIALVRWRRRGGVTRAWVAATFGILAAVSVLGEVVPTSSKAEWASWVERFEVATLALFPYFLYRFATSFLRTRRWMNTAAACLTAAAAILVLPFRLGPDQARTPAFEAWIALFLLSWVAMSVFVAVRLWRGGTHQPTIARRRMRMMALGASGLALALVLAGVSPSGTTAFQIAVEGFALASAPLFLIAVGPPKLLLAAWRRDADAELQHTLAGLVSAVTPQEVASALLPHATQALGGRGSVLVDREGHVIGAHGIDRDQAAEIARGNVTVVSRPEGDSSIVDFPLQEGRLLVEASVFTPYFGREEIMYMGALAGLIDLALARSRLSAQERIVLAELQSANETMRDFVAIASHDLRTPISVIRGFADVLASDGGSISHEERRSYLDAIGRQSDHLARLVEDLLTVSRIDARAVEPRPAAVDVESAVRRAVQDSRHAAGEILVETTPGLRANADPEHLARILQNYIDNAFAYGRPPVRVTTSGNGSSVQIRVIDAGVGVPPEFVPRMFEKFARADKAKSSKAQGTGLGLSIVRGLARAGGGEAWYERAPSGGACFVVSFPRVEASGG